MLKVISVALVAGGIILLIFGIDAWNSLGSDVSNVVSGTPTNRAIWFVVSGTVALIVGIGGLLYTPKMHSKTG
jgi:hypothetical protein